MVDAGITDAMIERMEGSGEIAFSASINKMTRTNEAQPRMLVIKSTGNIYLFDGDALNRKHGISRMSAIIQSTESDEVVLIFPTSKDLRISGLDSGNRDFMLSTIK